MKKCKLLFTLFFTLTLLFSASRMFSQSGTISADKNPDAKYAGLIGRVWGPFNHPAPGTYLVVTDATTSTLIADGISYGDQAIYRLSFLPVNKELHLFAFNENIPLSIYHTSLTLSDKEVYKLNITLPMPPGPTSPGFVTMPDKGYGISPASLSGFVMRMVEVTQGAKETEAAEAIINRLKWLTNDRYNWNTKSVQKNNGEVCYPIPPDVEQELKDYFASTYENYNKEQKPAAQETTPQKIKVYKYLIKIKGGGGINTETVLRFNIDKPPFEIQGKGRTDATDGKRIAISLDNVNYFDFQNTYWVNLSSYAARTFYVTLNSKWGTDKDSYMELMLSFNGPASITYKEIDKNYDDLEYVRVTQVE